MLILLVLPKAAKEHSLSGRPAKLSIKRSQLFMFAIGELARESSLEDKRCDRLIKIIATTDGKIEFDDLENFLSLNVRDTTNNQNTVVLTI